MPTALSQAFTTLLLRHPFIASVAIRLERVEDPTCPTAWTDGEQVAVNPAWFEALSLEQRLAVLGEAAYHVALAHHLRRGPREHKLWQLATDLAVNTLLTADGFTLPEGAPLEPSLGDAAAEVIYHRLMTEAQAAPPGATPESSPPLQSAGADAKSSPSSPAPDGAASPSVQSHASPTPAPAAASSSGHGQVEVRDLPAAQTLTESERGRLLTEHGILMTALAQQARVQGSDSAGARRAAALAAETATVDWRSALADFLTSRTPDDYSWTTPNPRYVPLNLYLPSLCRTTPGQIAFVIDTSGSVPDSALRAVAAELGAYLELSPEAVLTLLYVDAEVAGTQTVTAADLPLRLNPSGGGGTSFCPAFEYYDERPDETPDCLVYFTDLRGRYPEVPPPYPVLWLAFGADRRGRAPFGQVVHLDY